MSVRVQVSEIKRWAKHVAAHIECFSDRGSTPLTSNYIFKQSAFYARKVRKMPILLVVTPLLPTFQLLPIFLDFARFLYGFGAVNRENYYGNTVPKRGDVWYVKYKDRADQWKNVSCGGERLPMRKPSQRRLSQFSTSVRLKSNGLPRLHEMLVRDVYL